MKPVNVLQTVATTIACGLISLGQVAAQEIITEPVQTSGYGTLEAIAVSPDGKQFVTGGSRGAFLWDVDQGQVVQRFQADDMENVFSLGFCANGSKVITASGNGCDGIARLWDAATGRLLGHFEPHCGYTPPVLSPDGSLLLTAAAESSPGGDTPLVTVRLWNVATGELLHTFQETSVPAYSLSFSANGSQILGGFYSPWDPGGLRLGIRRWDVATGQTLQAMNVNTAVSADNLVISPDRSVLLPRGQTEWSPGNPSMGIAEVWDIATGQLISAYVEPSAPSIEQAVFAPDGGEVLFGIERRGSASGAYSFGEYSMWDFRNDLITHRFAATYPYARCGTGFSPDGKSVFMLDARYTVRTWDIETGTMLRRFDGHTSGIGSVAFMPDGTRFLINNGNAAQLWSVASALPIRVFESQNDIDLRLSTVDVSPAGNQVVASDSNGGVYLWDAATGELVLFLSLPVTDGVLMTSVVFSPDGTKLLTATSYWVIPFVLEEAFAHLWDATTGQLLRSMQLDCKWPCGAVFSPDGTKVLVGSFHGPPGLSAQLWDADSGQHLRNYEGATAEVLCVAFSPDGAEVLTGGAEHSGDEFSGVVRVWDADTGIALRAISVEDPCKNPATIPGKTFIPRWKM